MTQQEKIADTYNKIKDLPESELSYINGSVTTLWANRHIRGAEREVDADDVPEAVDVS